MRAGVAAARIGVAAEPGARLIELV